MDKKMIKSLPKIKCAVITVSDTRNELTDKSGQLIKQLIEEHHHETSFYKIVHDEQSEINAVLKESLHKEQIQIIIINGGTGIAKRDVTMEAVQPYLEKEIPGFGELFRYISYQFEIGSSAMLSRAIAGVSNNRIIFSLPGSTGAVRLAMEKLILPELKHLVKEVTKDGGN